MPKIIFFLIFLCFLPPFLLFSEESADRKEPAKDIQVTQATPNPPPTEGEKNPSDTETKPLASDSSIQAMQLLLKKKYAPPLSLMESIRLTDNVVEILDPTIDLFKEPRKEKSIQLMNLIINYVKLTDDRASSLLFYRWYYIGRDRVVGDHIQEETFKPKPIIKNVTAISFEAEKENVHIYYMKVIDLENITTSFKIDKWILKNVPRKEVCFLYFPTTIKEILINYSTKSDTWARLRVYAGVTDRPEFGKAALYYLASAKREIESGAFEKAKINLQKAKERLIKFNRQISL